ncbi:hypothetical protein swp_0122 [Shewanella piezotolerans WP3]|uniref:Uncharacterized protein n=1 Tax=Shewanella piezotolerans (strain WP3 / JCM 13877) TaxID=225849 RepID=B8CGX3_SHEPW|nr:hypothetical protein [Shewanella piezotolerans]ACJ26966.1 hypothetical protein swp_0122 [Shewanella piezotolerans WP3]
MPEPRITISSNPTTCLQRFEFPLNGQTFNAIGIIYGSDPQKFAGMIDRPQALLQSGEYCQEEYLRQSDHWDRLKQQYIVQE